MSKELLYTSLADLAAANTDDIGVLRNRLQKAGIYIIGMTEVSLRDVEQSDPDQKPRLALTYNGLVEYFEPLEKNDDDAASAEDMIGKNYTQRETIWLDDIREAIGLMKGRHVATHLPVQGTMGGVEGVEPGWLDEVVGKRVPIRVRHRVVGDDTRVYYDWLGTKALEKLGISWDDVGREPVDKDGNPISNGN